MSCPFHKILGWLYNILHHFIISSKRRGQKWKLISTKWKKMFLLCYKTCGNLAVTECLKKVLVINNLPSTAPTTCFHGNNSTGRTLRWFSDDYIIKLTMSNQHPNLGFVNEIGKRDGNKKHSSSDEHQSHACLLLQEPCHLARLSALHFHHRNMYCSTIGSKPHSST